MVERLSQWLNGHQRLVPACPFPVLPQLGPMRRCPLGDEASGSWRKRTGDDRQALDVDGGLRLPISGMEMGMSAMVALVVVHPDRDSVEAADSWHSGDARSSAATEQDCEVPKLKNLRYEGVLPVRVPTAPCEVPAYGLVPAGLIATPTFSDDWSGKFWSSSVRRRFLCRPSGLEPARRQPRGFELRLKAITRFQLEFDRDGRSRLWTRGGRQRGRGGQQSGDHDCRGQKWRTGHVLRIRLR